MIKKTIAELSTVVRGSSPRPKGDPKFYGGKHPRLMVADLTRDGMYVTPKIDSLTEEGSKRSRPMKKGDLVIAVSGDPGQPAILNVDACIHDGFVGLKELNNQLIFTPFLYRFFKFTKLKNQSTAVGAIYKNLNTTQIKSLQIPVPPLEEQKRIAAILDAADEYRQKTKALIDKYDELAQSLFLEMFGDPVTNPKGWEVSTIGKFFNVKGGKRLPKGSKYSVNKTNYPYIRVKDFKPNGLNSLDIKYISKEIQSKINRYTITSSDVYISIAGSIGIAGYIPDYLSGGNLTENAAKLIAKENVEFKKEYLSFYLNSDYAQQHIRSKTMAVGVPKLALFRIKELPFINAPIEMQELFVSRVNSIDKLKRIVMNQHQRSDQLFNSLLQRAFKGEL